VQLLNVFYNRWKGGTPPTQPTLTLTQPNGGERWRTNSQQQIRWTTTGSVARVNLYYSTNNFSSRNNIASNIANTNAYAWTTPSTASTSVKVRVESVVSPTIVYDVSAANFTLCAPGTCDYRVYLPLVLRNYVPPPPACAVPLTGVTISGPPAAMLTHVIRSTPVQRPPMRPRPLPTPGRLRPAAGRARPAHLTSGLARAARPST